MKDGLVYKKYCKYYDVYEDGSIYSHYCERFLKPDINNGYCQVTLVNEKGESVREKVHRIVAKLFLDTPDNYGQLTVNHIDGNKQNNHWKNLEWCTITENNRHARETGLNNVSESNRKRWQDKEWGEKVSEKISKTRIEKGLGKHRNNGRFRYEIFDSDGNELTRTELAEKLGLAQSTTDAIIRKVANGGEYKKVSSMGITITDTKQ